MEKQKIISKSIRNPIGCPKLSDCARGKKSILIVADDNTRLTPVKSILPPVLEELKEAGIDDNCIKILIAAGTHRPMTDKEFLAKFGRRIVSRFKIYNHSWNKSSALVRIDSEIDGKKIYVNRLAQRSDFIIGIGGIVPHATSGFSGGGKIILPGICGKETVEDMHWKALDFKMDEILGVYNNPMRKMIDTVAKRVGLKFIVNTILDNSNCIAGVVAGDPVKAHCKGVKISRRVFGHRVRHLVDIVIADAHPMDIDLRQAIKAVAASDLVVKKGGVIILNARCPEGVSPQFPEFEKYGFKNPDDLKRKVEEGKVKAKLVVYTLVAIGRIVEHKAKVILVSSGICSKVSKKLGFLWAKSQADALKKAKELTGPWAKTILLRRACEILPLMN